MSSVRDIARKVGVSTATVSRAINNRPRVSAKVREKVLAAMNRSRYVPTVSRRSTTNIAFAYTGDMYLDSPFDAALMQGVSAGMQAHGFDVMLIDVVRATLPRETFSQMFVRKGIRGALLRTTAASRGICEQIAEEGFPAIVVGDRFDNPAVSFAYSDSHATSRAAIEHLIALGHRRIAITLNIIDDSDHADRMAGYREALLGQGIEFDERLVFHSAARRGDGEQLMRRMCTMRDRPSAVYATDPMVAVGAMNEAQVMGVRVPEDLSIVGFDDADLRFLVHPRMTSVCQDAAAIGREVSAMLQEMLSTDGGTPAVRKAMPTWLEIHGSTAPAAPSA